jgi:putative ABC transport system ATP-binding protein
MENNILIKINSLSKVFQTEDVQTKALQDISLLVHKGEYVCITGPSGCGKSTLLSLLGLLDAASSGSYLLNGMNVSDLRQDDRALIRNREIGFVFQSFNLISDLTVEENVMLPLTYQKTYSKKELKAKARQVLDKVDMGHRINHFPSQLSGGQQQRVAIARALINDPSFILADEPTGNLDSENTAIVMKLLDELHREGVTICMVTHDPRSAEYASRQIKMFDGKILSDQQIRQPHVVAAMTAKTEVA